MTLEHSVQTAYTLARERFAELGADTDAALKTLDAIPISIHCWQGDDVRGFENPDGDLTGGIQTSGSYPGRARTATELRSDLDFALAQIPGAARLNLHAIYLEAGKPVIWTKPDDLTFDPAAAPSRWGAGSSHPGGFNAAMADGSVRFIKNTIDLNVFRAVITRAAGEVIGAGAF